MMSAVQAMSRTQNNRGKRSNMTSAATSSTNLNKRKSNSNVKKQLSALKLKLDKEKTKQKVIDGIPEADEKSDTKEETKKRGKKAKEAPKVKKSGRPIVNRKAKYPQIYGKKPIPEQKRISDNSGVLTMANFLTNTDDVSTNDEPKNESNDTNDTANKTEAVSSVPPRESKSPGIATVFSAKKTAMAWKTKVNDRFDPETQSYEAAQPQKNVDKIVVNSKSVEFETEYEEDDRGPDKVLESARYYLNERRNAHGKVKPLKTLKNKKKERNSGVDQRDSRMPEDKVNRILREHNLKEHERMLKQGRDFKQ